MDNRQYEMELSACNVGALHEQLKALLGDVYDGFIFDGQVIRFSLSPAITNDQMSILQDTVKAHNPDVLSEDQQKEIREVAALDEAREDAQQVDVNAKVDPGELGRLFKRVRLLELEVEQLKKR